MWPFRRRRPQGRHALGAAVTAIPSARPVPVPDPLAVVPVAAPEPVVEAVPLQVTAPPPAVEAVPLQFTKPVVEAPAGPRVELGFRDGSTTSLAPESAQARALTDIASLLTRRD